jgi:hypothetical protein
VDFFAFDRRFGIKKSTKTTPKPLQNPFNNHPETHIEHQHHISQILGST